MKPPRRIKDSYNLRKFTKMDEAGILGQLPKRLPDTCKDWDFTYDNEEAGDRYGLGYKQYVAQDPADQYGLGASIIASCG